MDCSELIKKVRLVINEAADDNDVSLLSVDTRQLDDTIRDLLPRAVLFIQKNKGAASGRVNARNVAPAGICVAPDASGGGLLLLPDDFVSLVSLQLKGWQSPAHHLYAHDSREAMCNRTVLHAPGAVARHVWSRFRGRVGVVHCSFRCPQVRVPNRYILSTRRHSMPTMAWKGTTMGCLMLWCTNVLRCSILCSNAMMQPMQCSRSHWLPVVGK